MKQYLTMLAMLAIGASCMGQWNREYSNENVDKEGCSFLVYQDLHSKRYKRLYGNVYVVKEGDGVKPDIKVRVVKKDEAVDYSVGVVKNYADECGLWRYVSDPKKANLKVKFVQRGENLENRIYKRR